MALVRPDAEPDERAAESALRPTSLAAFEGQPRVSDQLGLLLEGRPEPGRGPDHVLLAGPPGLGKTTLAMIIANEMSAQLRISSGPAIQHAGDLAAILSGLSEGEVFFLDEIHRMSRPAEEMLYLAMEDFRVDVVVGKGPGATAIPLEIPPFTLVGATTRSGLLPGPLRDRFGFTAQLDFYDRRRWSGSCCARPGYWGRPGRGRGRRNRPAVPRHATDRQPAAAPGAGLRPGSRRRSDHRRLAQAALDLFEVDELGLDRLDRAVLNAICRRFGGGPVGLSTLAISVAEETETVEDVAEPFLVRQGFLMRTPRGRVATPPPGSTSG